MAKKQDAEKLITVKAAVPVLICKANRPLTEEEHAELVRKLQSEQSRTGLEILLVPNSVDVEVAADLKDIPANEQVEEDDVKDNVNPE